MARVSISEYRAKTLLVKDYSGVMLRSDTATDDAAMLDHDRNYVVKVDQGIKKRGKQGLISLNVAASDVATEVKKLAAKGFDRFLAEPMVPHDPSDEHYLSIERTRDGWTILYSKHGGIEVEDHADTIKTYQDIDATPLPLKFMQQLVDVMDQEQLSFVEVNPLLVQGDELVLLDAAVLADSAGVWQASWTEDDLVSAHQAGPAESAIAELNAGSPSAFSFRVLNPGGAIWLLLSGGGASITIADEAANQGKAELIGNYGEYSGGPTREETQVYSEAVLGQVFKSGAPKKAIVIAGGVANFTDVKKTFDGIIDAFTGQLDQLQAAGIKVFVRRGGPNEQEGLDHMRDFLVANDLLGSVHGSDAVLTTVIDEAVRFVDA